MSVPAGIPIPQMLPVTATFAPAFAAYYALLNLRVSLVRVSCNTMMGTDRANKTPSSSSNPDSSKASTVPDNNRDLLVSARCHANFVENVPFALLLASLVEMNGGNRLFLTGSLAALLFFRIAHVEFGLRAKDSMGWGRPVGYFGTLGFVVGMSSYAAWLVRSYWRA